MSSRSGTEPAAAHRAGAVAIVGRPNVGKSTLLNRLVGCKVSITSGRPQTTRRRITGIVTRADAQIVFVDTPGYQVEHDGALNRAMNRSVASCLREVDAVIWVVEALKYDNRDVRVAQQLPPGVPVVLAISKVDAIRDKAQLLPFMARLAQAHRAEAIVPVSGAKGTQVDALLDAVARLLPVGPPQHDADEITTVNERVLAAELLREKLFRQLGDELPYAIAVEIEQFKQEGSLRRIVASIVVDKESHKPIVIGKQGATLKLIASHARRDMEQLFGGKVFLQAWVKVRRGWSENEAALRRMEFGE